ncbi:universal stress protein [Nocardiopsis sp. CT-R113]|uniref:Universal stress protein n=1 Tax=Nocardiopsis codii TaxID=3065942 RepID=A0ABU7KGS3_9ACTN|nr:universal stress protein [Nocardiopsis sp. CT-R113]MEE2041434.1 universal stress protein [Nocardiopsis sp. CT-R113]
MNAQQRPPAVVVGVDGSSASRAALAWATGEAARRAVQLRIVHGLGLPVALGLGAVVERPLAEDAREAAHGLLTECAEYARRTRPEVDVATVLVPKDAPAVLLDEAEHEDVVVVGSRGHGGIRAILLGSVSVRTSSHAPCPVVVVPDTGEPAPHRGRLVVGVDGSDGSRRALRFGLGEALLTGSEVVVVNSWEVPLAADAASLEADAQSLHEGVFDRQSEEVVAGLLAEVVGERTAHLDISAVRVRAAPVKALLEASADADLLVVGSRGRGGVRGLVMGSVSQGVIHRSGVPVAVLPPHSEETD